MSGPLRLAAAISKYILTRRSSMSSGSNRLPYHSITASCSWWIGFSIASRNSMKPVTPAYVLGRTPLIAGDKRRVVDIGLAVPDFFDEYVVAPVVRRSRRGKGTARRRVRQQSSPGCSPPCTAFPSASEVVLGLAVAPIPDFELEQVRVCPKERELNVLMEREERRREWHVDPAPDRGLNLLKLDPDPGNGLNHGGVQPCGGLELSAKRGTSAANRPRQVQFAGASCTVSAGVNLSVTCPET